MEFGKRALESLGDLVCGNLGSDDSGGLSESKRFPYRSTINSTELFAENGTDRAHDGSARHRWVAEILEAIPAEPHDGPARPRRLSPGRPAIW